MYSRLSLYPQNTNNVEMYSFFFANVQTHAHFSNQYLSRSCTHTHTQAQARTHARTHTRAKCCCVLVVVTSSVNHVAWLTAFRLLIEVGDNARMCIHSRCQTSVSELDWRLCLNVCTCVCVCCVCSCVSMVVLFDRFVYSGAVYPQAESASQS